MNSFKTALDKYPLHPFIFALYPVLFLWVDNIDQTPFFSILRSLAFSGGFALFVYLVVGIVYRNLTRAAFIAGAIVILTLSFGHIYNFIEENSALNNVIGYYRLLAIMLLVLAACVILVQRSPDAVQSLNRIMHTVSFLLLAITIGQIGWLYSTEIYAKTHLSNTQITITNESISNSFKDRDIYYIVLDGYSREDVLTSHYDFDNVSFINKLRDLGFVIPECTQSNYNMTSFSMISSLNMDYLTELPDPIRAIKENRVLRDEYIKHSSVRKNFDDMGFLTVSFKSIYPFLNIEDADIYYDFEGTTGQYNKLETENFQYLFFNTSVLRIVIEILEANPEYMVVKDASPIQLYLVRVFAPHMKLFRTKSYKQYEQYLYVFERLENLPELPGNKFVYAHLLTTHQPFVFTANGLFREQMYEYSDAYRDQITYTNIRMLEIIERIINKSATPPIIILQGDHSSVNKKDIDRNKILNAYYLPEGGSEHVTSDFTPVNTFRLVFNTYFGGDYEILPNIAYSSQENYPYQFEALPLSCVESID